jgi:hypothetical protein
MRWQRLFADLEALFDAADSAELDGEVADRTRREAARLRLVDRLHPATDETVTVAVLGHGPVTGCVAAVGADWMLLAEAGRELLVPEAAIAWVTGPLRAARDPEPPSGVQARLTLGHALRALARDRAPVAVTTRDGIVLTGTIDRVGADHVELAEHPVGEPPRTGAVSGRRAVTFAGLALVRSGQPSSPSSPRP